MVVYSDETTRVAALQTGDVDLIEYVPWQSTAAIQANPKLNLETVDGPFIYMLLYQLAKALTRNGISTGAEI